MPLPESIGARLGRMDAATAGGFLSQQSPNGGGLQVGGGASLALGTGRDSLILLAVLVVGVVALARWTR